MPVGDWTDAPAGLNGLVRFAPKRNLVSARVLSHFKRSLPRFRKNLLPSSTLKIWAETFYETLVSIYRTTRYQPTVMSIPVTVHKIYHNVQLFAPAIRVDLVKWLQFLTPKAGGNESACNTNKAEHLVLNEVQRKCYFLLCRHDSILQLLSHTNRNTWNDQIPARCVACRSQSDTWQSMFLLPFLLHSRVVMK